MKKFLVIAIVVAVIAGCVATPVLAGKHGSAGKSNVAHLYLYEKYCASDWSIVPGGAWGKLKHNLSGPTFDFVFNGHGLVPGTDYSLIYYADPWPGNHPGALIASGTADADGNLHLAGSPDLNTDLPNPADANYGLTDCGDVNTPGNPPLPFPCNGAKIWLVPTTDYNASTNSMVAWNCTEYLYENLLIRYDDTDVP